MIIPFILEAEARASILCPKEKKTAASLKEEASGVEFVVLFVVLFAVEFALEWEKILGQLIGNHNRSRNPLIDTLYIFRSRPHS